MNNSNMISDDTHQQLWNQSYLMLIVSNVLLYTGVYMLFPVLHKWMVGIWNLEELTAGMIIVVFGLALFIPGVLNNYLVDRFSRKSVCMRSILLFALSGILYPYVTQVWMIVVLRVVQGALFGLVLMSTGSTLVIDVTPHHVRDKANLNFAYSGIMGMFLGLSAGFWGGTLFSLSDWMLLSAGFSLVALVLMSFVRVSFRAPMDLPLFSMDRFLLMRNILPGLNMIVIPLILGMIIGSSYDSFFYLCVAGGFMLYLLLAERINALLSSRIAVATGILMLLTGMYLLSFGSTESKDVAGVVIGAGTGLAIYRFLKIMIKMPLHCERGTGYHTYQLMWELNIMVGVFLGDFYYKTTAQDPYYLVTGVALAGLLFFVAYEYPHFVKVMKERNNNK